MLRATLNFAAHPVRNYSLYSAGFRVALVALAGLTALHAVWLNRVLAARDDVAASLEEAETHALTAEEAVRAAELRLDRKNLAPLNDETAWANGLIAAYRFSWTELLDNLEQVLPPSVFVQAVVPSIKKDGTVELRLATVSKTPADLAVFLDALEASPIFAGAYPENEREDLLKSIGYGTMSDVKVLYLPEQAKKSVSRKDAAPAKGEKSP